MDGAHWSLTAPPHEHQRPTMENEVHIAGRFVRVRADAHAAIHAAPWLLHDAARTDAAAMCGELGMSMGGRAGRALIVFANGVGSYETAWLVEVRESALAASVCARLRGAANTALTTTLRSLALVGALVDGTTEASINVRMAHAMAIGTVHRPHNAELCAQAAAIDAARRPDFDGNDINAQRTITAARTIAAARAARSDAERAVSAASSSRGADAPRDADALRGGAAPSESERLGTLLHQHKAMQLELGAATNALAKHTGELSDIDDALVEHTSAIEDNESACMSNEIAIEETAAAMAAAAEKTSEHANTIDALESAHDEHAHVLVGHECTIDVHANMLAALTVKVGALERAVAPKRGDASVLIERQRARPSSSKRARK